MIARAVARARTRPFNVNVFCHAPGDRRRRARGGVDRSGFAPEFARFGATPPRALREIYTSFVVDDDDAARCSLEERSREVVSFHFGLPPAERIAALRGAGIVLLGAATSLAEARALVAAGVDASSRKATKRAGIAACSIRTRATIVSDTLALTRLLARELRSPGHRGGRDHGRRGHRRAPAARRERGAARHGVHRVPRVERRRRVSRGAARATPPSTRR